MKDTVIQWIDSILTKILDVITMYKIVSQTDLMDGPRTTIWVERKK